MLFFAERIKLIDKLVSVLLKCLNINLLELHMTNFPLVFLIPLLLEFPYFLKIFDFLINLIQVCRAEYTDLKELKSKSHVIPTIS